MNRVQKTEFVDDVRGAFQAAPFVILTDFKGSTVVEIDRLRRSAESAGASFRVVKNTLCRIAVADTHCAPLAEHFSGNIGVVFSGEDPVATAKMFRQARKENEKLEVRVGFFEGGVLDVKQVDAVADLPSREDLLARLLGVMIAAPRKGLAILQAPAMNLLYVLQARARQLDDQG